MKARRSSEGDETADHDGDGAMSFKELLRCQPVVFMISLLNQLCLAPEVTDHFADFIVDAVTDNGGSAAM